MKQRFISVSPYSFGQCTTIPSGWQLEMDTPSPSRERACLIGYAPRRNCPVHERPFPPVLPPERLQWSPSQRWDKDAFPAPGEGLASVQTGLDVFSAWNHPSSSLRENGQIMQPLSVPSPQSLAKSSIFRHFKKIKTFLKKLLTIFLFSV